MTCPECGGPLDPDVTHVQHDDGCWLDGCYAEEGCYCDEERCADCCQDPDCPLRETPPWHAYDGCYGCRRGNAIARKALREPQETP